MSSSELVPRRLAPWTETLCAAVDERGTGWFCDRFADLPGEVIETIRAVEPTLDGVTPRLVHADPSRINLHVEPLGLLDWERALVGDPAYGLVEAEFHHLDQPDVDDEDERPALREALYAGYRDRRGELPSTLERYRPLYRAVAHLLVPQAFDDWAPDVDRPLAQLSLLDDAERAQLAAWNATEVPAPPLDDAFFKVPFAPESRKRGGI